MAFFQPLPQPGVPGRIDTPPVIHAGGRESPFLLTSKARSGSGAKSPPAESKALKSGHSEGGDVARSEGPPLLAPIATLPRAQRELDETGQGRENEALENYARQGRSDYHHIDVAGSRRDSSPSTPRPDDRETFH